jgi:hypothetical protein
LGQNYWKGGVFGASTYKDNVTPIIPFWLMGDLSNSYMLYPNGSRNYTRGQVVEFDGVIKDDCGLVKTDSASFGVEYIISHGSTVYTIVAPLTYTTWTIPQDAPLGWYNVTMIAFAEGSEAGKYWNGTYFKENAFFVASNIKLDNPQVSPYPKGSWQVDPFNFSVYVTSEDGEPVYTYLWLKRENSNWQLENSSVCVNCNNYQFFTQKSFYCSDIGSWYAKFNATSPTTFKNETQVIAFNITKTPISIDYSSGNNSVVNRSDSVIGNTVNLTVRIKNLVFGNYTTEISTDEVYGYVTKDDVNWEQEIVYSNETHYFITFNPSCSYSVGLRKWKVNVSSACYESNSSQEFYVIIVGSLANSIISPTGDRNYTAGEKIYLIGEVYDDCGNPISDASIRFKLTSGSNEYYCPSSGYITNTSNTYVCEFDTTGKSGGWYNVSMESSKQYYLNASSFKQNAFFLITPVELVNPKVEYPNDGSWGEIHNFSVIVNHYASVNVCLLESTSSDGPWSVTDCRFIENPSYTLVNFTRDYTCSDYQQAAIRYFMFNASEPNVPQTYSNTSVISHTLRKDDISLIYVLGNESYVNRNGNNSTKFMIYVLDRDKNSPAFSQIGVQYYPRVWFNVFNGTAFITDGSNSTNSSGYVEYNFNPDCRYDAGKQNWIAYVQADACYKDASSEAYNVTIVGDLVPFVVYPNGITYYRENQLYINISAFVQDECKLRNISGAEVTIEPISVGFGDVYNCDNVQDYGNGTYSCTFNATEAKEGWYNVRVNASNVIYYNDASFTNASVFRIIQVWQPPVLEDATVFPEDDWGWGENYTFKVNVSDANADDVNVSLWLSKDGVNWNYISSQMCYNCGSKRELTFYYSGFTCSDIGTYYFKFNATDPRNTTDMTPISFNLDKDDVDFVYDSNSLGNNSWVNRSESVTLKIKVYDRDNEQFVDRYVSGKIWVTYDGVNYGSAWEASGDNGYLSAVFIPDCSYSVGTQYWKAGIVNDACYKNTNSTLTLTVNIKGWLNNTISQPNGEAYLSNQNVTISGLVNDECNNPINDAYVFYKVKHGTFEDYCFASYVSGYYTCTWNISNNPPGWYSVFMYSSRDLYNNASKVKQNAFFHEVPPVLVAPSVTPAEGPWGSTFTFKVNVTDEDDIVNVSLWIRKLPDGAFSLAASTICNNCTNVIVTLQKSYTSGSDIGSYEWFINASDNYGGVAQTIIQTFNVTKRRTYWVYSQGNNSWVSRVGTNTTILEARLYDAFTNLPLDKGSDTTYINVSSDTGWIRYGTTTSLGFATLNFDPDCRYSVGIKNWRAAFDGDSYYFGNVSENYTVVIYGSLASSILQPNGNVIAEGDPILIVGNVSDDCSLGVTGASTIFTIEPIHSTCSPVIDYGNGTYACSFPSSGLIGWYDISMNVSKQYYNDTYSYKSNAFQVRRKPAITSYSINRDSGGWGSYFLVSASVLDADPSDPVNISLWKSYDGINWVYVGSKSSSDCTGTCYFEFNPSFNCSEYLINSTILLKLNVSDSYGLRNETSPITVTLTKDTVSFYSISVPSEVLRYGNNYGKFVVRVYDVDKNAWLDLSQENVKGYFWFTRDTGIYDEGHLVYANASGYLEYDFNPDCSYNVGYQSWKVGIASNQCYFDANSSDSSFIIKGQLNINLNLPTYGSIFNVGDKINISWNVYSDCYLNSSVRDSGNISEVSNVLTLSSGSYSSSCSPINEDNGNYNCTWDSTSKPEGYWNITIQASKTYYSTNTTTFANWFWLENRPPVVSNLNVTPNAAGWGSLFNYSAYVEDPENDIVTCSLYVKTTDNWVYKGSKTINTPGVCYIEVNDFTCEDQGIASFYFVVNDTFNRVNTSDSEISIGPAITKNSISLTIVSGDGAKVNRSDSNIGNTVSFVIRALDLTRNSLPLANTNLTFYVTYDQTNFKPYYTQTNSSGYASLDFNPDCQFSTGKQAWFAKVENDACYFETYTNTTPTQNYTVEVYGDLVLDVISPKGEKYLRGDYPDGQNVNLTARITSDCEIEGGIYANANFSVSQGSIVNYCNPVEYLGNGYYTCSLNTSGFRAKGWNVTFNASKSYYNSNSTLEIFDIWKKGFWVETKPILTTDFYTISYDSLGRVGDGGWGELWVFRVNITDEDDDLLEVKLWINRTDNGEWYQLPFNMTAYDRGINKTITFMLRLPSPTALGSPSAVGPHAFMFNVSEYQDIFGNQTKDFPQNVYQTNNGTLIYKKDDVIIEHVIGNNTSVYRPGNNIQTLTARVYDVDKGEYAIGSPGAAIFVTTDFYNYTTISGTSSISPGGYINTSLTQFNPDCSFAIGPQKWKAGVLDTNPFYKPTNSSEFTITIVTDPLNVNYISPKNGKIYIKSPTPADYLILVANVTDDCGGVRGATTNFYIQRVDTIRECRSIGSVIDFNNGTYACNITNSTLNSNYELTYGYWNVSVNASKQYYNDSLTTQNTNAFYLASRPTLSTYSYYVTTGNYTSGWGDLWQFKVDVDDEDRIGELGSLVNVSLWINKTGDWEYIGSMICTPPCTGSDALVFTTSFSCADIGTHTFKFNATDNLFVYDNRLKSESSTQTFTVDKEWADVYILSGDGSSVYRPGYETAILQAYILDWSKGTYATDPGIRGYLHITKDRNNFGDPIEIYTGSDGSFTYYFDPDCNYTTGRQIWFIELNDTCYRYSRTSNASVYVYGQLYSNLNYPPQGWVNGTGVMIPIVMDVKSDCSGYISEETPSVPNSIQGITNPILIQNPVNSLEACQPITDFNNGTYYCEYNTTRKLPGLYSIILQSAKDYFYSNQTTYSDWFEIVNLPPRYSNPQVTPSFGGWGDKYNFSIDVLDTDGDDVNCSLFVSTDNGNIWRYVGSQIITGGSGTCRFENVQPYTCNDTFNDVGSDNWFRFNLTDVIGQTNTSTNYGPIIDKDVISISLVSGNNTNITRAFGYLPLRVYVTDLNRSRPVGSDRTAQIEIGFNVTFDGSNFLFAGSNRTYSSLPGNVTFNFDPNCSFNVGLQNWKAFYKSTIIPSGECYHFASSENYTIGIVGQLLNFITSPNATKNKFIRDEENITWRGYVTTDCSAREGMLSSANVSFYATHTGTGNTFYCDEPYNSVNNEGDGYYNCLFC